MVRFIISVQLNIICLGIIAVQRHLVGSQVPAVIARDFIFDEIQSGKSQGPIPGRIGTNFFGNGLGVCAHGHHFLMDLIDGEANTGSLRVQSLATLMRTFWQKPWGGFDPSADLIQIGFIVRQNPKREVSGGESPGRIGTDLTAIAWGTWAPAIIVMDFGGRLHRESLKYYSGHAR